MAADDDEPPLAAPASPPLTPGAASSSSGGIAADVAEAAESVDPEMLPESEYAARHGLIMKGVKYFDAAPNSGNMVATLHSILGSNLKATCKLHPGCSCFVSTGGRYFQVRNMLIKWISEGRLCGKEQHLEKPLEVRRFFGMTIR